MTILADLRELAAELRIGDDEHAAVLVETVIAKHWPRRADARAKLTDRQRKILDFIAGYVHDRGRPPTLREIGDAFEIRSTNGVSNHLKLIEGKGYLVREPLKSRGLRLVDWP
jgi:DNA-binding MarR family transcriptional regulator